MNHEFAEAWPTWWTTRPSDVFVKAEMRTRPVVKFAPDPPPTTLEWVCSVCQVNKANLFTAFCSDHAPTIGSPRTNEVGRTPEGDAYATGRNGGVEAAAQEAERAGYLLNLEHESAESAGAYKAAAAIRMYLQEKKNPDPGLFARADNPRKEAAPNGDNEPLPVGVVIRSGTGALCDMKTGPCACGAWHTSSEWGLRMQCPHEWVAAIMNRQCILCGAVRAHDDEPRADSARPFAVGDKVHFRAKEKPRTGTVVSLTGGGPGRIKVEWENGPNAPFYFFSPAADLEHAGDLPPRSDSPSTEDVEHGNAAADAILRAYSTGLETAALLADRDGCWGTAERIRAMKSAPTPELPRSETPLQVAATETISAMQAQLNGYHDEIQHLRGVITKLRDLATWDEEEHDDEEPGEEDMSEVLSEIYKVATVELCSWFRGGEAQPKEVKRG